ncbi:MAG: hypothetical protein IPG80_10175 [Anaerolineales bacterium]|uniref:hypothetical protein n=1 Tax=Candidatus Villigracilis vicinus TaxID=3140679 RepID=UPI003134F72C|nr:hypothetical protein [Anaerolineales bacterium]
MDAKRDPSFLLSGTKLAQYEGWAESSAIALTQHELDYLKASLSARDQREVEEAERLQREKRRGNWRRRESKPRRIANKVCETPKTTRGLFLAPSW